MELIVTLKSNANTDSVRQALEGFGLWTRSFQNTEGTLSLAVKPHSQNVGSDKIRAIPGVADVFESKSSHPRIDELKGQSIFVGDLEIGGEASPLLMAGPCSISSRDAVMEAAELVAGVGAKVLRGGAFKPRTSPYTFNGHGSEALSWMREAADRFNLKMITEVMSEHYVEEVIRHASGDAGQLVRGARRDRGLAGAPGDNPRLGQPSPWSAPAAPAAGDRYASGRASRHTGQNTADCPGRAVGRRRWVWLNSRQQRLDIGTQLFGLGGGRVALENAALVINPLSIT